MITNTVCLNCQIQQAQTTKMELTKVYIVALSFVNYVTFSFYSPTYKWVNNENGENHGYHRVIDVQNQPVR